MELIQSREVLLAKLHVVKTKGERISLVPTMGALHEGHLELVRIARQHSRFVLPYIFLNPTQFNASNDFERYPRTLEADLKALDAVGADAVFAPSVEVIYPEGFKVGGPQAGATSVLAGRAADDHEGPLRPGHFNGVVSVLCKFFNLVRPDVAVFGEKDYQQLLVVRQMVRDLCYPIEIIGVPTVRDNDGLALSSRNKLLSAEGRYHALFIYKALCKAQDMVRRGETSVDVIRQQALANLEHSGGVAVEYLEIVDPATLSRVGEIKAAARALVAARVGNVRLIDNMELCAS